MATRPQDSGLSKSAGRRTVKRQISAMQFHLLHARRSKGTQGLDSEAIGSGNGRITAEAVLGHNDDLDKRVGYAKCG